MLADIIREMREERGRQGWFDDSRLRERVEVLGPEVSLEVLRDAVSTALVDRLGVTWDERYGELKRYKERFGDCNVPKRWNENTQLASWVRNQRAFRKRGMLWSDRERRLDELCFDWGLLDSAWERMFAELKRYSDAHGHCDVRPAGNRELNSWVKEQRHNENTGKLSASRKARLDALGFTWDHKHAAWEKMFSELKRYKERFGDCQVSKHWEENPQFAAWIGTQRAIDKKGLFIPRQKEKA